MADSDDIIDYVSDDISEDEYDDRYQEDDEDDENTTKSLETSDILSNKQSNYKVDSITSVEESITNISNSILLIKKRYTRRISLFEITGILAESYNLLQRGRLPLINDLSDETMKQNILHILIKEINEGTCPIIIEKNGELLSVSDFDKIGLSRHINYIINIWKKQNRY
ncbi:DNA-dependent RNA polymerase subunit RPO19 [Brazilian porcupinepox virus 1]|nr:DNA-dependent RNA polymerase subunit RPO19 [Brazilian porcupinepox virus 1]